MAASSHPEELIDDRPISSGTAMKLLDKSRSAIYRYIESGDLHPVNTLPPGLARHSRKKRTLRFSRAEVLRLKAKLGRQD